MSPIQYRTHGQLAPNEINRLTIGARFRVGQGACPSVPC